MGYSSGVINTPVEIEDIQDALNDSSEDDLNDLCRHANINPWAKYKPVRYPQNDTRHDPSYPSISWLTESGGVKVWNSYAYWWRNPQYVFSEEINTCGFSIPAVSGVDDNIANELGPWTYNRPRGGAYNEPYRQLDFNQYYHYASIPFSVELPDKMILMLDGSVRGLVRFYTPTVNALNLSLNDIFAQGGSGSTNQCYIGVAAVKGTNVYIRTQTASSASFSLEGLKTLLGLVENDVVTLVAFVTRHMRSSWDPGDTTQVYSLDAPGRTFDVVKQCVVKKELDRQYVLTVSGFDTGDRPFIRNVSLSNGQVTGDNDGVTSPTNGYDLYEVACKVEIVTVGGGVTTYDQTTYTISESTADDRPNPIEKNAGPYSQFTTKNRYPVGGLPALSDPTEQYYRITYTMKYQKQTATT